MSSPCKFIPPSSALMTVVKPIPAQNAILVVFKCSERSLEKRDILLFDLGLCETLRPVEFQSLPLFHSFIFKLF